MDETVERNSEAITADTKLVVCTTPFRRRTSKDIRTAQGSLQMSRQSCAPRPLKDKKDLHVCTGQTFARNSAAITADKLSIVCTTPALNKRELGHMQI